MSSRPADDLFSLDDESLAAELVSGRHEALTVLFKRYSGAVFRTARRILGDSGEAEEAVQQTFLEMFLHISEFDPQKGSFIGWLLRRAKFRAVNRKDHLKTERFYDWTAINEAADTAMPTPQAATDVYRQEVEPLLEEFLRKLSPRRRKVVSLTFFEGRTAEEIATQMDESVHVVRHLLYEGLQQLRSAAAQKRTGTKQMRRN